MTFGEEAAELYRLEAVALSLGLTEPAFEDILLEVIAPAQAADTLPAEQLAEVRQRIHEAAARLPTVRQCQRSVVLAG